MNAFGTVARSQNQDEVALAILRRHFTLPEVKATDSYSQIKVLPLF